MAAQALMDEPE